MSILRALREGWVTNRGTVLAFCWLLFDCCPMAMFHFRSLGEDTALFSSYVPKVIILLLRIPAQRRCCGFPGTRGIFKSGNRGLTSSMTVIRWASFAERDRTLEIVSAIAREQHCRKKRLCHSCMIVLGAGVRDMWLSSRC